MGNAILYCAGCNTQLRESDFEKGHAFRSDARAWCKICAPADVRDQPPPKRLSDTHSMQKVNLSSTRRMEIVPPAPEPSSSKIVLYIAGGVVAVGLLALAAMFSGGTTSRPVDPPPPSAAVGKDPIVPLPPAPPRNDKPAEEALRRAREFAQAHPENFPGQLALFDTAVREAEGTGHHPAAVRERDAVLARQKDQAKVQLDALDAAVKAACDREEFAAAYKTIDDARSRPFGPDWSTDLGARTRTVDEAAGSLFAAICKDVAEARKRNATEEVKRLTQRVDKWGIDSFKAELSKVVASATPKPPPPTPAPPKEIDTYRKRWTDAIAIAAGRDYPAALKKLDEAVIGLKDPAVKSEAAADAEILKTSMSVHEEGLQALLKTPKGQKSSLAYLNSTGLLVEVAGTLARVDAAQMDLTTDKGMTQIPVGEIAARSIAQALKGKRDGRDLALLCLAEGDAAGAKTFADANAKIPDKYWKLAPAVVQAETEARRLFYAADRESGSPAKAVDAAAKFASLLKDRSETAFVKRNRALIAARAEPPREFFFLFEDLRIGGAFKAFKGDKDEQHWRAMTDAPGAYVEVLFSGVPDTEYRCFVYAGGCCAEALSCTAQVVEGTEPPGEAVAAKQVPSMPFKTHASHEGRGRPTLKWGWVQMTLPKFTAAGVKKVRVLSPLKGFAVGQVLVSATRSTPPGATELRDLELKRVEQRGGMKVDPSLVGHWKFAESSGTTAADSSALGAEGRLVNGGTWTPGAASPWSPPALKLEGKAYVDLGSNLAMLQNTSGFTMAAWICPDKIAGGSDQNKIFSLSKHNGTVPTSESRASLCLMNGGYLSAGGRSTDTDKLQSVRTNDKLKTGTWYHVAGVVDLGSNSIVIYLNGVPQATNGTVAFSARTTSNAPSTCAAIGSEENEAKWTFQGRIADVRIYNRALSREEVAELSASSR
jgi:hypothetical protein